MEALFGKEFGGMQPQPSSPVLHGGMYTGGSGSMPRPKSAGRLQGLFSQPKSMKVSNTFKLHVLLYQLISFKSKVQTTSQSIMSLHDNVISNIFILLVIIIFKGTLRDALDRYSLYGLEENSSYDCNFKSEIEDIIKLVSILNSVRIL